ncbi:MAG TPA: hypothetical protein PKX23_19585, partial [Verrucomicrobiota bacterium]|nr:hypothetical protein [Verrucomicrobiota bacterium]
ASMATSFTLWVFVTRALINNAARRFPCLARFTPSTRVDRNDVSPQGGRPELASAAGSTPVF